MSVISPTFENVSCEQINYLLQNCTNLRKLYMYMHIHANIYANLHEVITNDTNLIELGVNVPSFTVSCMNALKSIKNLDVVNDSGVIEWGK